MNSIVRITISFAITAITAFDSIHAQEPAQREDPCAISEAAQFDFWVGSWDVTWDDTLRGTNTITKELDGCAILERFDARPAMPFKGMSLSIFNTKIRKWQQAWVDNAGGYMDFVGEFKNGQMILGREVTQGDSTFHQRMVFYNIKSDELDWNWERSNDDGRTWNLMWKLHYTKRK